MMKQFERMIGAAMTVLVLLQPVSVQAQGAADPSTRLRAVLPAAVAERVLARVADARARGLPADALEQRALKFASKGVSPADIERSVNEHAARLASAKDVLDRARARTSRGDEIEAGAEVLRLGVDGASVASLAKSAPSGRSLAVPLYVVGSLVSRGLPADSALATVRTRLVGRASDAEIENLSNGSVPGRSDQRNARADAAKGASNRPEHAGTGIGVGAGAAGAAGTQRGGPPVSVPRNVGKGQGKKP